MKPSRVQMVGIIFWAAACFFSSTVSAALSVVATGQDGFLAVDSQKNLWGTNEKEGKGAQQVVKFSGKRPNFIRKAFTGSLITHLKPKGSQVAHNFRGRVEQVWPLPDGNVLFMAGVNGKSYLYKLNPKKNTVGNNPAQGYNNKQAVMNVGERYSRVQKKTVHFPDIRGLHQRSLLVAKIAGKTVLFFGEYNVTPKKTLGGDGDAVGLWRSNNLGNTWSKVVEWNTNGVHTVDHIHGLKQNPYNGWIYILFGDDDKEPGIVAWNGVARAIPDNTPLASIGLNNRWAGWRAISGTQDVRTGDIVFTKDKCVWLPDRDLLSRETLIYGQQANHDLSGLKATNPFYFDNGVSPIIAEMDANGVIYWASFRTALNYLTNPPTPTAKKVFIWTSTNSGFTWSLPLKINVYSDWTSVPQSLFVSSWGDLVMGGNGLIFGPNGNSSGSSVFLTP